MQSNKQTFQAVVGLDVSQETLTVALLRPEDTTPTATHQVGNHKAGYRALLRWVGAQGYALSSVHFVLESSGSIWQNGARFLVEAGVAVSVVNPKSVHHFGLAELRPTKTDEMDAALIARYGQKMTPPFWQPLDPTTQTLFMLLRARRQLQDSGRQFQAQIRAWKQQGAPKATYEALAHVLATTRKEMARLEQQIRDLVSAQPDLSDLLQRLMTVPGIGFWTACVLVSETSRLTGFRDGRALASYAGLAPMIRQSGKRSGLGQGLSANGNPALRRAFYLAALSSVRARGGYGDCYERLLARGKSKKKALCAVARHLVMVVYALVRDGSVYDPHHSTLVNT